MKSLYIILSKRSVEPPLGPGVVQDRFAGSAEGPSGRIFMPASRMVATGLEEAMTCDDRS